MQRDAKFTSALRLAKTLRSEPGGNGPPLVSAGTTVPLWNVCRLVSHPLDGEIGGSSTHQATRCPDEEAPEPEPVLASSMMTPVSACAEQCAASNTSTKQATPTMSRAIASNCWGM